MISKAYRYLIQRIRGLQSRIRILHFRLLGVRIGRNCYIDTGVMLVGNVSIGNGCVIGSHTYIGTASSGRVEIGERCHIGKMNQIGSSGDSVLVGEDCIFAPYVHITDGVHVFRDRSLVIKDAPILTKPVRIDANVWLGSAAMVMQGVVIGEGAVVGAKALVNRDVPPYSVVAGLPAKVMYQRS